MRWQWILTKVTHFERHETHTEFQRSVALKVFFAQFVNTGLIVLLVNAKVPFQVPAGIGILDGQFSSFNNRWNAGVFPRCASPVALAVPGLDLGVCRAVAVVGTTVVITMLLNIITPHFPLIFLRIAACFKRRKSAFRTLVTQSQADAVHTLQHPRSCHRRLYTHVCVPPHCCSCTSRRPSTRQFACLLC